MLHPHPGYCAVLSGSVRISCEVSRGLNLGAFEEMPCGYLGRPHGGMWGRVGKEGERKLYWSPFCSGSGPPGGTKETISANSNRLCDQEGSANTDRLYVLTSPTVAMRVRSITEGETLWSRGTKESIHSPQQGRQCLAPDSSSVRRSWRRTPRPSPLLPQPCPGPAAQCPPP